MVLLAAGIAAVVSFNAVKWLLHYVQPHTFKLFGWYRIALAITGFHLLLRHQFRRDEFHEPLILTAFSQ
jgi:undecaprenyl pyrophosphate phosphatase UppP